MIDSNKLNKSHGSVICASTRTMQPLFDIFTSIEALRWTLFARNTDVRGWELRLRDTESKAIEPKYLSHRGSFIRACQAGQLEIVKAMVERTQVDWRREARGEG